MKITKKKIRKSIHKGIHPVQLYEELNEEIRINSQIRELTGVPKHLHNLIKTRYKYDFYPGCGCLEFMQKMEEWGIEGCWENLDTIVKRLRGKAKEQGGFTGLLARVPGIAYAKIEELVLEAIHLAEKELQNGIRN